MPKIIELKLKDSLGPFNFSVSNFFKRFSWSCMYNGPYLVLFMLLLLSVQGVAPKEHTIKLSLAKRRYHTYPVILIWLLEAWLLSVAQIP